MRAYLIALSTLLAPAPLWATTVTVHNRSNEALRLKVERSPSGYEEHLRADMAPGLVSSMSKPAGKVLMPHAEADEAVLQISYVDARGAGCRFSVMPVRHSDAYARVLPSAEPIGGGRCEAATGSTIGDFVFVVR